ncbi:MAG: flagellar cap protein FliD N-terminal domain-containing protein, partial [Clostridium sp.]
MATGLDVDQIVKDTMRPHRIKIQQQQQQKEILEIKQKLYREV